MSAALNLPSFVFDAASVKVGSQPTFAACCTKVRCGPFVSFDTKGGRPIAWDTQQVGMVEVIFVRIRREGQR